MSSAVTEFQAIMEEAYIYGFPMFVAYKVLHDYNVNRGSGAYIGPMNQLANEARVYTPKDTAVSTPNSDTPYSFVQLDLRAEPMVLCMPEVEQGRYYDVQLTDMYTNNFGYMGSRTTGNGADCYMVAGPNWTGETPQGLDEVFQSESDFTLAIYRTQLFSASDMPNVERTQAGYSVQPLSAFLDEAAPRSAPAIDWPEPTAASFGIEFPKLLSFLFQFAPVSALPASDQALRARLASIGIEAGTDFDTSALSADHQSALAAAVKAATAKIEAKAAMTGTTINGWQIGAAAGSREFFDGDWALRAAGAKLGIYGNSQEEATYPFTRADVNDVPLDGSKHAYTLTFPAGGLPPVNAFWSVTMYDGKSQFLIKNPIDRYLINSPMLPQLKKNADGSLTIYIQHADPGPAKRANWLPAPDGPIFLVLRLYDPQTTPPSILPPGQGTWKPPALAATPIGK